MLITPPPVEESYDEYVVDAELVIFIYYWIGADSYHHRFYMSNGNESCVHNIVFLTLFRSNKFCVSCVAYP